MTALPPDPKLMKKLEENQKRNQEYYKKMKENGYEPKLVWVKKDPKDVKSIFMDVEPSPVNPKLRGLKRSRQD